jgi:hypothetical protein
MIAAIVGNSKGRRRRLFMEETSAGGGLRLGGSIEGEGFARACQRAGQEVAEGGVVGDEVVDEVVVGTDGLD